LPPSKEPVILTAWRWTVNGLEGRPYARQSRPGAAPTGTGDL